VSVAEIILILSGLLFVYPFALYQFILPMVAPRKRIAPGDMPDHALPSIAMVTCALNEEGVIGEKAENCLALDYPREKVRYIFVSDGSTDRTAEIVSRYRDRGVELIERDKRRGKVTNLNDVIPRLTEPIVMLSDANTIYDAQSLRRLVRWFADPAIGCVSGKVILCSTTEEFRSSEESYYSIEWKLQELASSLYSMAGADGAMYCFRRELFQPPPSDTLIEDFVIPMGIVRQNKRVVFEPAATSWEVGPESFREEYRRRIRIAAGAAQSLIRGNGLPVGAPLRFWFIFISHKLLRWLSPIFGIVALVAAAASWREPLSQIALAGFVAIAGLAILRAVTGWKTPLLNAPYYFLFAQLAVLTGLLKGFTGTQSVLWAKKNR
jgi:poly-beta-1,6-N-acetyl-D-glucosamine synthase